MVGNHMHFTKTLVLMGAVLVLALSFSTATGRPVRSMELDRKVAASDMIVIAQSMGKGVPRHVTKILTSYEELRVLKVLNGEGVPSQLRLVTGSLGGEWRPNCCQENARYVLFLNRGYPAFKLQGGTLDTVMLGGDEYVSSSDGVFGIYEIRGQAVMAWPDGFDQSISLNDLECLISRALSSKKINEAEAVNRKP